MATQVVFRDAEMGTGPATELPILAPSSDYPSAATQPTCQTDTHSDNPETRPPATAFQYQFDPAENLETTVPGWPTLARLLATVPDFEGFQAFSDLNIKSLLCYQAELVKLRKQLHEVEWDDFRSVRGEVDDVDSDRAMYAENLGNLLSSRDKQDPIVRRQWILLTEIRGVLREYSMLVIYSYEIHS
jgi:hypothetical protein